MNVQALHTRLPIAVGIELRRLRHAAGLRQADVGERTGIHRPIVGRIERGLRIPTLDTCARFANACGGSIVDVARAIDAVIAEAST